MIGKNMNALQEALDKLKERIPDDEVAAMKPFTDCLAGFHKVMLQEMIAVETEEERDDILARRLTSFTRNTAVMVVGFLELMLSADAPPAVRAEFAKAVLDDLLAHMQRKLPRFITGEVAKEAERIASAPIN